MSTNDINQLIKSYHSYIQNFSKLTGQSYKTISQQVINYNSAKTFFLQPSKLLGIIHKTTNSIYAGGGFVHALWSTGTSYISTVAGPSLLAASPSLILITPLVCGVSFALLERLSVGKRLQAPFCVARDFCLIPVKIGEVCHNKFGLGRVLRFININALLNITSLLSFGNGT